MLIKKVNDDNRIRVILKWGGVGFIGGVIICYLLKWNLVKVWIVKLRKKIWGWWFKSVIGKVINFKVFKLR